MSKEITYEIRVILKNKLEPVKQLQDTINKDLSKLGLHLEIEQPIVLGTVTIKNYLPEHLNRILVEIQHKVYQYFPEAVQVILDEQI